MSFFPSLKPDPFSRPPRYLLTSLLAWLFPLAVNAAAVRGASNTRAGGLTRWPWGCREAWLGQDRLRKLYMCNAIWCCLMQFDFLRWLCFISSSVLSISSMAIFNFYCPSMPWLHPCHGSSFPPQRLDNLSMPRRTALSLSPLP